MAGAHLQPNRAFLRQAALILFPLIVLAAVGWLSLRQDKAIAEVEIRERGQALAEDLLPELWTELAGVAARGASNAPAFRVDDSGELVFPPSYEPVPAPRPFSLDKLTPEQARLWATIQTAIDRPDLAAAIETCEKLLASNPPENFAAVTMYQLGLLLIKQRKLSEAVERFSLVSSRYPDAVGETGLPLEPLAQFKMIELQPLPDRLDRPRPTITLSERSPPESAPAKSPAVSLEHFIPLGDFCSNIVYHPTPLTPFLMARIEGWFKPPPPGTSAFFRGTNLPPVVRQWKNTWAEHELLRKLYGHARSHPEFGVKVAGPILSTRNDPALIPADNSTARFFWLTTPEPLGASPGAAGILDRNWLVIAGNTNATGRGFVCRSESDLGTRLTQWIAGSRRLPRYFSLSVSIAGKRISEFAPDLRVWRDQYQSGKGGGHWDKIYSPDTPSRVLGSSVKTENGMEQLKVNVHLINPTAVFERQRWRSYWFGSLIAVSTVAALIGLAGAWRAFNRQQQLGEMKSNFVSSVSHELRAPIASVRLLAESLERGTVQEAGKQKEYFRFIGQECRRLSSLIENVLDFSRIEQGRKQYEFEPTDLAALVRDTVKGIEPYAAEKGVELKLETANSQQPTAGIQLQVDGRAIQQALVNLIDNAIKHSPKGQSVIVGIELPDSHAAGETLSLQPSTLNLFVEDHGPGIPLAEHEKIFERFYRRGSELRRETQGVGIGLSIVKHIVEAHGGNVAVRSDVGQGSRFTIELPVTQ